MCSCQAAPPLCPSCVYTVGALLLQAAGGAGGGGESVQASYSKQKAAGEREAARPRGTKGGSASVSGFGKGGYREAGGTQWSACERSSDRHGVRGELERPSGEGRTDTRQTTAHRTGIQEGGTRGTEKTEDAGSRRDPAALTMQATDIVGWGRRNGYWPLHADAGRKGGRWRRHSAH